jgi:hypothetical protein
MTKLNELEAAAMNLLLAGDIPLLQILRTQLEASTVTNREYTGVGFFTHFQVPHGIERPEGSVDSSFLM